MPNIGAVILAAGESSRLGQPKQLIQLRGKSLVRGVVEAAEKADCSPIVVVTGSERAKVEAELNEMRAITVENQNWRRGIGTSIRAGVERVMEKAPKVEAILLLTCDQPFVDARTIEELMVFRDKTDKAIVASAYSDTVGIPALFDRSCFQELLALSGDFGAKSIIVSNPDRVAKFPFPEGNVDIDTAEDLEKVKSL